MSENVHTVRFFVMVDDQELIIRAYRRVFERLYPHVGQTMITSEDKASQIALEMSDLVPDVVMLFSQDPRYVEVFMRHYLTMNRPGIKPAFAVVSDGELESKDWKDGIEFLTHLVEAHAAYVTHTALVSSNDELVQKAIEGGSVFALHKFEAHPRKFGELFYKFVNKRPWLEHKTK